MTTEEIQLLANSQAERKGSTLDLSGLLLLRVQDFCRAAHFDWRRKAGTLSTVAGTATYDLSATMSDMEEIIAVLYARTVTHVPELAPIQDPIAAELIRADTSTTGEPGGYLIEPGTFFTIRITPIPAGVYSLRIPYWAIPETFGASTAVPLVPAILHGALVKGLKMDIWANVYGESSTKYQIAKADYDNAVLDAIAKKNFNSGRVIQFKSRDSAIRSTR